MVLFHEIPQSSHISVVKLDFILRILENDKGFLYFWHLETLAKNQSNHYLSKFPDVDVGGTCKFNSELSINIPQ